MRRALVTLLLAVALAGAAVPTTASVLSGTTAQVPVAGGLQAGVGVADFSWHVGSGSGQHSTEGNGTVGIVTGDEVDPYQQTTKQRPSSGVQSRLSARALVFEGSNGERVALVK